MQAPGNAAGAARRPAGSFPRVPSWPRVGRVITVRVLSEGKILGGGKELLDREGPKWVDVEAPIAEELTPLAKRYGLHPLAIEDALHLDQRPKLEEYPGHLFVVLHAFQAASADPADLALIEQHFFIGPDWVITVHERHARAIDEAVRRFTSDPAGTFARGPDFIAYCIADGLADQNFPILDALADELEELEDKIFEHAEPSQLQRVFGLKRALVTLRRILSPQRDVVGMLSRRGLPNIQERTTLYFRDIYDHLVRIYEQIDAERDLLTGALEAYLSAIANRTNDITKQLTIFATIFLPLSFVTGFFGQNFPQVAWPPLFWVMMGTVIAVPLVLWWWFWRKGWI